jgi:hypothetical protein
MNKKKNNLNKFSSQKNINENMNLNMNMNMNMNLNDNDIILKKTN